MAFVNQTIDDRDSILKYQGFWFLTGTWNASHTGTSGTLSSSSDPNCNVTFTFPVPARAFYYYGIPRCCGGLYQICVDCDPNNPEWQKIDAVNTTDDGKNPPIVLYSQHFSGAPGVHEVILSNTLDARFGKSQITLDKFDIEFFDPSAPTPATTSTSSDAPSSTSTLPSNTSPASHPTPIGAIVGAVVAGVVLLGALLFVFFLIRRRRQVAKLNTSRNDELSARPRDGAVLEPYRPPNTVMQENTASANMPFFPKARHNSIAKGAQKYVTAAESSSYPTTSTSTVPDSSMAPPSTTAPSATHTTHSRELSTDVSEVATRSRGRREVDAGPVSMNVDEEDEEEEGTLPPDYRDVFNTVRTPTVSSRPR